MLVTKAEMRHLIERMEHAITSSYTEELLAGQQFGQRAILLEADHKLLKRLAKRLIERGLA